MKGRITHLLTAFILGCLFMMVCVKIKNFVVNRSYLQHCTAYTVSQENYVKPIGVLRVLSSNRGAFDPLARLFQIIFILFFISPPIIAILLFLIWKELKARNDKMQ